MREEAWTARAASGAVQGLAALLLGLGLFLAGQGARAAEAPSSMPRSLGVLLPVSPPDYQLWYDRMKGTRTETFGAFTYRSGAIDGVPVVINVAPATGPLMRSFAAYEMMRHYNVGALLYPGTSGAHLGPEAMRIGDVVLGAGNVDFGNFFMSKDGTLVAQEFAPETQGPERYGTFYMDPVLLSRLACAAWRTAAVTTLPPSLNRPEFPRARPDIFYWGMRGTSEMWLADKGFIDKVVKTFGVIDEDGDWDSNLVAVLHGVPFIEVSAISDSILEFPETERGFPLGDAPASATAQRIANDVLLDLIAHDGKAILAGRFVTDAQKPFPGESFATPKDPKTLLKEGGCG